MYDLAPGNVLQNMYLRKRLKLWDRRDVEFVELGSGNGNISNILLSFGMRGVGFDLNPDACALNRTKNAEFIESGKYAIENGDFFQYEQPVDLIISSHVIEHFSEEDLDAFFKRCKTLLKTNGKLILLVPSSMEYWGIEDETAGHYRRFEFEDFRRIEREYELQAEDIVGLTFPVSNVLLSFSNYLIRKNESWKKDLSMEEKTLLSAGGGSKKVKYKSVFPSYFRYLVNEVTMYPFHVLQQMFRRNPKSMIIYCEYQG